MLIKNLFSTIVYENLYISNNKQRHIFLNLIEGVKLKWKKR